MEHHHITAEHLSVGRVREILERRLPLALSDDARARIVRCREYLDRKMENPERPIYGITTGFGSLCDISVGSDELSRLQQNLVMSHACGTGERVPSEIVRLILLLKIQSLAYGHSGVQLATVERLVEFFNRGILPVVYQQGSLGASGDLAPLALTRRICPERWRLTSATRNSPRIEATAASPLPLPWGCCSLANTSTTSM